MSQTTHLNWHIQLRRILVSYFSEDELRTLCFDLRVDYDDLRGSNKTKKAINLISHLARLDQIEQLLDLCREARPHVVWGGLRTAALQNPLIVEKEPDKATGVASKSGQRSPLFLKQRDKLLFGMLIIVLAVLLSGIGVALIVSARAILLSEDFEDGQVGQWRASSPAHALQVVALPDGNHALQLQQGREALYTPAWDWVTANYRFEADVMVRDLNPNTSIGLHARMVSPAGTGYCQGYRAEIGPGHTAIHLIKTSNCYTAWQYVTLTNDAFTLKAGEWHRLRLDVNGNQLRFFIDGFLILATIDRENTYATGGVGVIVFSSDEAYVDNVVVTALSAQATPAADLIIYDDSLAAGWQD